MGLWGLSTGDGRNEYDEVLGVEARVPVDERSVDGHAEIFREKGKFVSAAQFFEERRDRGRPSLHRLLGPPGVLAQLGVVLHLNGMGIPLRCLR